MDDLQALLDLTKARPCADQVLWGLTNGYIMSRIEPAGEDLS